jgi:hypothetical protein
MGSEDETTPVAIDVSMYKETTRGINYDAENPSTLTPPSGVALMF